MTKPVGHSGPFVNLDDGEKHPPLGKRMWAINDPLRKSAFTPVTPLESRVHALAAQTLVAADKAKGSA